MDELNYPEPIVEHSFARERAIRVYKEKFGRLKEWEVWKSESEIDNIPILPVFQTPILSVFHTVINLHQDIHSVSSFITQ